MLLHSLEIKNFRSLEHVKFTGLGRFNVLIGRNNAGKSAVFEALALLANRVFGREAGRTWPSDRELLTDHDLTRALSFDLTFALGEADRAAFVERLCAAGFAIEQRERVVNSALLRQISCSFASPMGRAFDVQLESVKVQAEDGQWTQAVIRGEVRINSQRSYLVAQLEERVRQDPRLRLDSAALQVPNDIGSAEFSPNLADPRATSLQDHPHTWVLGRLAQYFNQTYFLGTFRHGAASQPPGVQNRLTPDGSNLPVVLNYLAGADKLALDAIEAFVHTTLPDVGLLHAPLTEAGHTDIVFRTPRNYQVRLSDMGSGVEQLLMAATVLHTEGREAILFLEEPESHLHAGAQRYLIEQLYARSRQVFVATHSPTFVNVTRARSLHQVKLADHRTTVTRLRKADELNAMLDDIGARNSDVLLSDAVLFVEGPTDRDVFQAWSETLEISLAERNVTVLPMGGGDDAGRQLRARGEVLIGMSQAAPVPHLFVVDRDERGTDEIEHLVSKLGERVHVLDRREIENYLLAPRAIREALLDKYRDDDVVRTAVERADAEDIAQLISTTAEGLFGTVLLKRVRVEIGGLRGGLLPRDILAELDPDAKSELLPSKVEDTVKDRLAAHLKELNIPALVVARRGALEVEWNDAALRLHIAPGEELLSAVFDAYGGEFEKRTDAPRIARHMADDEIDSAMVELIRRAHGLP